MNVLIDTHALFWFVTNSKHLSTSAKSAILEAETIFIPTIVLLELLALLTKLRQPEKFNTVLAEIESNPLYTVISLDMAIVHSVTDSPYKLEMHDKVIVTSATLFRVPIITKDRYIRKVYPNTVW